MENLKILIKTFVQFLCRYWHLDFVKWSKFYEFYDYEVMQHIQCDCDVNENLNYENMRNDEFIDQLFTTFFNDSRKCLGYKLLTLAKLIPFSFSQLGCHKFWGRPLIFQPQWEEVREKLCCKFQLSRFNLVMSGVMQVHNKKVPKITYFLLSW